ncbi:hypothetical protein [Caulobacter phage Cd1]|uniref:Uncharacterized protein n=1 Tax=Caulobacter phage Cd1 TaxID=718008 RepID=F1ADP1_9CAUD|nr:hypothetical protein [Caulobacter phage Cd1]
MTMSKDRVHFFLPGQHANDGDSRTVAVDRAAVEAFGLPLSHAKAIRKRRVEIVCRPSQFARFLIFRNVYGGVNDFKGLEAKLVTPPAPPEQVDVSRNPAK